MGGDIRTGDIIFVSWNSWKTFKKMEKKKSKTASELTEGREVVADILIRSDQWYEISHVDKIDAYAT